MVILLQKQKGLFKSNLKGFALALKKYPDFIFLYDNFRRNFFFYIPSLN